MHCPFVASAVHPMEYWFNDESTRIQWLDGGFQYILGMAVNFGAERDPGPGDGPAVAFGLGSDSMHGERSSGDRFRG